MSQTLADQRPQGAPYATLRAAGEGEPDKTHAAGPAAGGPVEPDYLALEADKLESLKQALFTAFIAAPKAGIPTALVDLAATYTSALRLQMTLKGYSAVQAKAAKAPMFGATRAK